MWIRIQYVYFNNAVDIGPAAGRQFCLIFVRHNMFVHVSANTKARDSVWKEY